LDRLFCFLAVFERDGSVATGTGPALADCPDIAKAPLGKTVLNDHALMMFSETIILLVNLHVKVMK